jgi:hypothetical protein
MKDIRPALRTYLLADPTVNGLVGGVRIHYARLPQGQTEPSVVFTKVSELADYVMSGDSAINQSRIQFDAWAQTASQAVNLGNAVYDRISGAKGDLVGDSPDIIAVRAIFLANGDDSYDALAQLYRQRRDYLVWYMAA